MNENRYDIGMAYSELVKNFNRIREYMREFYVYGFKTRDEYTSKSARSYDNERRRLESWMADYMQFRETSEGKNVFISIDSRASHHNPFYKALKTKSFTDGDITLHFILFDIMHDPDESFTLKEIMEEIDSYEMIRVSDESTVRKKLKEYVREGIVVSKKEGKKVLYQRAPSFEMKETDVLDYFSEVLPCGVIGSYLLDKYDREEEHFIFKHHYMTGAIDSDVMCELFLSISDKRNVILEQYAGKKNDMKEIEVVPLKIMISSQSGRQYLMAYSLSRRRIASYRLDRIISVKQGDVNEHYDSYKDMLEEMKPHLWGVSSGRGNELEHVDFTITYNDDEDFIPQRLEREKRCGTIEVIDEHTLKFSCDVYDVSEMIPWIRTFISRIKEIHISDERSEQQFKNDLQEMYELYGLESDEHDLL